MVDPREAIDRLTAAFGGPHAGHRTLHARGAFYEGSFTATPEAGALCRAAPFTGEPVPVTVRWSNGGGNPDVPDKAPDVRGMALKLHSSAGDADLLGQTSPRFPVRDPADFVSMTEAAQHPATFPWWMLRHPRAVPNLLVSARAKPLVPPYSFAEATYYPIHAYGWIAPDGTRRWVRYQLRPLAGERPVGTFEGFDRLRQEIVARLAEGPVRFDLHVDVAAVGDDPHDPTSVWKVERELSAGVVEVTGPVADPEESGGPVVFDPTRVVDGIELSDDPILRYRPGAYSVSIERRTRA
ncbi:MAG: catalase [Nocardioides sp.]